MRDQSWLFRFPWGCRGRLFLVLALWACLCACAEFRGIPTHGGGKRFSEEERVVSGSIRRALADMDLKELRGKSVMFQIESIANNGGGYITFPGVQGINANYGLGDNTGLTRYLTYPAPGTYLPFSDNHNQNDSQNYGANASGTFSTNYNATTVGTESDLSYLRSALTMKAQHSGLNIAPANPEYVLYVLVDVMGTNRSRDDSFFFWTDRLLASCELTYYAQNTKTGALLFRARHASAEAEYREKSVIGFTAYRIDRTIASTPPTPLPVDGDEIASSTSRILAGAPDAKKPVKTSKCRRGLARLLARSDSKTTRGLATRAAATPAPPSLKQSLQKYLESQLANARMQLQVGNLSEAQRLIDGVRAVRTDFPGLHEVEAELTVRRKQTTPPGGMPQK